MRLCSRKDKRVSSTSNGSPDPGASEVPFVIDGECVKVVLDTTVYRLVAIQKAGYRLAQRFTLVLGIADGSKLPVALLLSQGTTARDAIAAFYRELCDQELRENVAEQTKDIRSLLLAHAFSRTDLVKRE